MATPEAAGPPSGNASKQHRPPAALGVRNAVEHNDTALGHTGPAGSGQQAAKTPPSSSLGKAGHARIPAGHKDAGSSPISKRARLDSSCGHSSAQKDASVPGAAAVAGKASAPAAHTAKHPPAATGAGHAAGADAAAGSQPAGSSAAAAARGSPQLKQLKRPKLAAGGSDGNAWQCSSCRVTAAESPLAPDTTAAGAAVVEGAAAGAAAAGAADPAGSDGGSPASSAAAGDDDAGPDTPAAAASDAAAAAAALAAAEAGGAACNPGTAEFEAAAARKRQALEEYNSRMKHYAAAGRAKPDMIAFSELRDRWTPAKSHGHIPGVAVGEEFLGRGQLAILGLHTRMMAGIMSIKGDPKGAYAICMSGGYKDDADGGHTFWYTGAGGQNRAKRQEADQSYDNPDNAALVAAGAAATPVRVMRGKKGEQQERLYVYEGLYRVAAHKQEPSQDGPLVIKFRLEAIPGHSKVSSTVVYKCLSNTAFHRVLLAGAAGSSSRRRRSKVPLFRAPSRSEVEAAIRRRADAGSSGRLVSADISNGQENLPIPVWNEVDDDDRILAVEPTAAAAAAAGVAAAANRASCSSSPAAAAAAAGEGFAYIADYTYGEAAARDLATAGEVAFTKQHPGTCGIEYLKGTFKGMTRENDVNYTDDGLLMCSQPCGVMECDEACSSRRCKGNAVVAGGLRAPLEVFKAGPAKGWGVRCTMDLPVGAVVCCYIGEVVTDEYADRLRNKDAYLFDLNHFHMLTEAPDSDGQPVALNPLMPELSSGLRQKHLVVDARRRGNIGRFINHSCEPNCLVQTCFTKNARSQLLYYIVIVASQDIPAATEITYDYGYKDEQLEDNGVRGFACDCGAPSCRGRQQAGAAAEGGDAAAAAAAAAAGSSE